MKKLAVLLALLCVGVLVGCGGGGSNSGGGGGNPTPTLVSISVAPGGTTLTPGQTQAYQATGSYSDGTTKSLTSSANWLSSNTGVATITTGGVVTAVATGTSNITASSGGVTGQAVLTVANPVVSIAVTASSTSVAPNATLQFTAVATLADKTTKDITATATWQSSNSTIASVSGTGLATGVAPGNVTITATDPSSHVSGSAPLTVTNPLVSVTVTPANSSVAPGTKPQFTATATYFDKSSAVITAAVNWSSSNTSVATISNAQGLQGLATAVTAGNTTITATDPATQISGSTQLTVTNATIQSIAVTPATTPIPLGLQQQYTATATLSDGSTQDVTNIVTWTSSDPTKVTITTSGLATGVGITSSPVTITATAPNSVSGGTTTTVNAGSLQSIALKPTNITSLAQGTSQQFTAIGTFNNGSTLDITNQVTWASNNTTLATVVQKTGVVHAASSVSTPGQATISATLGSVSASVVLNITNAAPTGITITPITPPNATIQPGATQTFRAVAAFNDGTFQDVTLDATWTSSDPTIAVVNFPGRLLGKAAGLVTVTAQFTTASGTASLTVTSAVLQSIAVTPPTANLKPGATLGYQANGTYSDSTTANLTGQANWSSSDKTVATITNGLALGQSAGAATITATYQGISGSAALVVTAQALTSIAIAPNNPKTYAGVFLPLTATGDAGGQPIPLTASATWASSNGAQATVSNAAGHQGQATGVSPGSPTITAVFGGVTGSTTLTVSSATLQSITVTPNPTATVATGSTLQFHAIGTFSDSSTLDLSSQVIWTSSVQNIATISGIGVASGAAPGNTNITATFQQPGQSLVTSNVVVLTVQ